MAYDQITYSDKYYDDKYEYRHVILPTKLAKQVPKNHLMTETEWRNIGVQQSPGWVHYMVHAPERHILLFRRPLPKPADQSSVAAQESVATELSSTSPETPTNIPLVTSYDMLDGALGPFPPPQTIA